MMTAGRHDKPNKSYEDFLALLPTAGQLRDYHDELRHARLIGFAWGFLAGFATLFLMWALRI